MLQQAHLIIRKLNQLSETLKTCVKEELSPFMQDEEIFKPENGIALAQSVQQYRKLYQKSEEEFTAIKSKIPAALQETTTK